jgi:pimeloyl-ACP methyl ester carboxylesterase
MVGKVSRVPTPDVVRERVRSLPRRFRGESANGLVAEWDLRVGGQEFTIAVRNHRCTVSDGPGASPATVITTDPATWVAIDDGALTGGDAFFARNLDVRGNLDLAVRLQTLFRPYRRARKPTDLDQVEVQAGGVRLSCYVMGRGTPMLLLHGLGGSKGTLLPILSALADRYRLVVPDLPGHGESEKQASDHSPRFYAHVMRCLLDEMAVERAVVLGNSLGGRVALEMALRSPKRVSSLVLLDPSLPGLRWRYVASFTKLLPTEIGAVPFPMRERLTEMAIRRLFASPTRLSPEAYSLAAAEFIRVYRDPRARMAFFSALRNIVIERPEPFLASLRRIKQPALVIFGQSDRIVPPRLGVRLAQQLPNARFVALPGVGHVPQFEAPAETLQEIEAFLSTAPLGSPEL